MKYLINEKPRLKLCDTINSPIQKAKCRRNTAEYLVSVFSKAAAVMLLVPQHVLVVSLVYVRYEASCCLVVYHGDRGCAKQPPLELYQLAEEASVWSD
jgi:hypothetical protein